MKKKIKQEGKKEKKRRTGKQSPMKYLSLCLTFTKPFSDLPEHS